MVPSFPCSTPEPCILLLHICHTHHAFLHPWFDQLNNIYRRVKKSLSSSLCSFFQSLVPFSLWGPHIFLSALSSNTLSMCSCLSMRNQVSHPYKTKDKLTNPQLFISFVTVMYTTDSLLHLEMPTTWTPFSVILVVTSCSCNTESKRHLTSYLNVMWHHIPENGVHHVCGAIVQYKYIFWQQKTL